MARYTDFDYNDIIALGHSLFLVVSGDPNLFRNPDEEKKAIIFLHDFSFPQQPAHLHESIPMEEIDNFICVGKLESILKACFQIEKHKIRKKLNEL